MADLHGSVAPGFERVRAAFARNFDEHGEVGGAVCVVLDGRRVVDLWGGSADPLTGEPWLSDTLALVFSTTKGITAACIAMLVERGELEVDAPVARYWPEFAAAGKQDVTLRMVLSHRVGLPAIDGDFTLEEVLGHDAVCAAIAAQAPAWPPGSKHGYHVRSYGWMLGEIVRRVTGETLGAFIAREIAKPLGVDFFLGLPEEQEVRVAPIIAPPKETDPKAIALREQFMGPDTLLGRALSGPSNLFEYGPMWNTRALHAAEMPSSNGICSARGLARTYAALVGEVDGVRLLSRESVARACEVQSEGSDAVILVPMRFGLGFSLPPSLPPACPESCFGHAGAGGSLGFADSRRRLGFGYVMNQMKLGLVGDARASGLTEALYACLGDLA